MTRVLTRGEDTARLRHSSSVPPVRKAWGHQDPEEAKRVLP